MLGAAPADTHAGACQSGSVLSRSYADGVNLAALMDKLVALDIIGWATPRGWCNAHQQVAACLLEPATRAPLSRVPHTRLNEGYLRLIVVARRGGLRGVAHRGVEGCGV